jgi:large conductance mechanosensitive channel
MFKEFKDFALRGNVLDMAVGIILGVAFGGIVKGLVDNIIMPPFGLILGNVDFSDLFVNLGEGTFASLVDARDAGAPVIAYGEWFNSIINFVIVAFVLFILIRYMNRLKRKEEAAPAVPPAPTRQEVLLEEIRDLLRK